MAAEWSVVDRQKSVPYRSDESMANPCPPVWLALFVRCLLLAACSLPFGAHAKTSTTVDEAGSSAPRPIEIRFDSLSPKTGLELSVSTPGDFDGMTTFSNTACCGIKSAQQFVHDLRVYAGERPLRVMQGPEGWTVRHMPGAPLRVSYRLSPSGPMKIDVGVVEQLRPIVDKNSFHVIGTFGLLLPVGRQSDVIDLSVDASRVASDANFACSFGAGSRLRNVRTTLGKVAKSVYVGGAISLSIHETRFGKVAIAYGGMDAGFQAANFSGDALAILGAERKFFGRSQPWFLVSVRGGVVSDPEVNLGGGTGLTTSFAMFARSDLDSAALEHREQFRLVLAHEYFHNWNGLTLRVAQKAGAKGDDASVYWFSEGVTEFYALRTLTRLGLMSPERALKHLDSKLRHYAANRKRDSTATEAGVLFWSDPDGEQIPYLRGYLAAWVADGALMRASSGEHGLDQMLRALVARGETEPGFRVDNRFLVGYLTQGMSETDSAAFRKFVVEGGNVPLTTASFAPCLTGRYQQGPGSSALQFDFAQPTKSACFRH
jgi:predicted metalloprotease with PDZ domain